MLRNGAWSGQILMIVFSRINLKSKTKISSNLNKNALRKNSLSPKKIYSKM